MNNIVTQKHEELKAICQRFQVKRLFVFGSVLTTHFNEESDIDFAVDFNKDQIDNLFDNYCDLKDALSSLFCRPIDLVDSQGVKNPIFRHELLTTRQLVYGLA